MRAMVLLRASLQPQKVVVRWAVRRSGNEKGERLGRGGMAVWRRPSFGGVSQWSGVGDWRAKSWCQRLNVASRAEQRRRYLASRELGASGLRRFALSMSSNRAARAKPWSLSLWEKSFLGRASFCFSSKRRMPHSGCPKGDALRFCNACIIC